VSPTCIIVRRRGGAAKPIMCTQFWDFALFNPKRKKFEPEPKPQHYFPAQSRMKRCGSTTKLQQQDFGLTILSF
jgi:hypothetical protein